MLSPWNIQLMSIASTLILFTSIELCSSRTIKSIGGSCDLIFLSTFFFILVWKSNVYSWLVILKRRLASSSSSASLWWWWSLWCTISAERWPPQQSSRIKVFLWLTKEVVDGKTNSSKLSGHGIDTSCYMINGWQIMRSKKFLIKFDGDLIMYGMTLSIILEIPIVSKCSSISIIYSNDLVLWCLRAKSSAVHP